MFPQVQTRPGKLREIGWNAWRRVLPGLGTSYVSCQIFCPLVVSGDGKSGSVTEIVYNANNMKTLRITRHTTLMGTGYKRVRLTGSNRFGRWDKLALFDQTPYLAHVERPAAWGHTSWHVVRGKTHTYNTNPQQSGLVAEQVGDLPRWFPLLHQMATGCWKNVEWSPLVDWLIETSPLIAPYLTQPGDL